MSKVSGDEQYKLLINNILHDKKKYPFLGHNRVTSTPITESVELPSHKDCSIPVESYAFLLEEFGSWENIYNNLFGKTLEDLRINFAEIAKSRTGIENDCTLRIIPIEDQVENEDEIEIGASKLGGKPDLPDSVDWPLTIDSTHAMFFAQINLNDLRQFHSPKGVLPSSGWLFFFVGPDDSKHSQDMKQPFSFYWNGSKSDLKRREPPDDASTDTPIRLEFDESCEQVQSSYPDPCSYYPNTIQLFGHSVLETFPTTTMLFMRMAVFSFWKVRLKRYDSVFQNRVTDWDSNSFAPLFIKKFTPNLTDNLQPTQFWRREDILVPGQEIEPPKKLVTANFLKEDPVTEWKDESLPSNLLNKDKCFRIHSILSNQECMSVRVASLPFYTDIHSEYPKEYRNCERALLKSQKLADLLWERIKPYLNEKDYKNVQPYGFDNSGVWKPIGINECFRFSAYKPQTYFKPHKDAQFVRNDNEKSIFTVLLYLNEAVQGGSTLFLQKVKDENQDGSEMTFRVLHEEFPAEGTVIIFNHDLYHQGSVVNYGKVVLRSEIVFQRVDALSVPRSDYRNTQKYRKVKQLVEESNELERQGDTKQSLLKYLHALDVQTNMSPSLRWLDLCNKSALERLPEEIICIICSFLTSREVATLVLPLSSLLNSYSRSPPIWKEKYCQEWQDNIANEEEEDEVLPNEIYFNDKKAIEYSKNEIIYQTLSKDYKDWYATFVSRMFMEKFWSPVLLDPGRSTYRFGLQSSNTVQKSLTICSQPNHPHFYLPGFGLKDILVGARASDNRNSYLTKSLPLVDKCGRIENYQNFKTLLFQLYVNDLRVKFQHHPLVLAVPFSWSDKTKSMVQKMIFELGIPLACLVDSSKLLAYNYSKPTCLLLNISSSGVSCVPIRNYEPINELKVFKPFDLASNFDNNLDISENIYGMLRLGIIIPPTIPECRESNKEIWNNFTYEPEVSVIVGRTFLSFNADLVFQKGNQLFTTAFETLKSTIESINSSEEKVEFSKNILVCGGFSSLHGMKERLTREIKELYPEADLDFRSDDMEVIGGAKIFANLDNFKEYLECDNSKQ